MYLKKYPKVISFLVLLFLGLFSFIAYTSSSREVIVNEQLPSKKLKEVVPNLIVHYPEKVTKNVRYKLDSLLKRINKRYDFHGSVLIAKNEKIVYENQIGIADFKKKTLLNKESVFQLASVSKQFTAAAIMLLKERNQIKLTDTVNTYFPNFPYKAVTIKNLLNT